PAPNPQVVDSLHMAGIGVGAFSEPSEAFGRIAGARLSSMLAYAAWGARWPDGSHFYKLRQLGVDRLATLKPTDSALQVIVADTQPGDAPAVLVERENDGAPNRKLQLPLAPLTGLPMASQASLATRPGGVFVSVSMPGSLSATVATCLIPGFVTVLIVSREDDGPVELQQYFNPIDPQVPVAPGFDPPRPDDVRLVELSWRALEARDPLDSIEYGGLLQGKRSNPLLGLIAGYRMLGTPAADEFLGPLEDRHAVASAGKSPLWNMLSLFADLPDVHVLAALYDTPNRDEHFARAAAKGTPLLALGFASLVDWMTERAVKARELPPEIAHTQLPGVPWTAWTSLPSTVSDVEVFRVVTASGRRYRERSALAKIASGAQRVGMLRAGDTTASCFAISNSRVLCPGSAIRSVTKLGDSGPVVRFQGLQGPASFVHAVQSMPVAGLPESDWPWLLTIDPIAPVPEIVLAASMPAPSAGLAVVGYASSQIVIPPALWAHFETIDGIRQALLGKALVSAAPRLRYECYVAAGVEGGLVLDVDLGHVLGVHVGPLEDGRTGGFGIDAASLAATLLESGTGISIAGGS
ncbi:MAG TPA: hypothetical protein VJR89_25265, partial [Polyangiales bacterium]|nr:hypothetical protein [Polyangiales bacterium]